ESGCAAAPLIVAAHPHLWVCGDVVRPSGATTVLRDHPHALVVRTPGQRYPPRLTRFGSGGLQFDRQRRADAEPVQCRDHRIHNDAANPSLELELAQRLVGHWTS